MVLTISYPRGEVFFGRFNFLCKESETELKWAHKLPPPQPPPPNPQLRFSVRRDCGPCMPRSRYVLLCNLSHPKLAYQRAAPPTSEGGKKRWREGCSRRSKDSTPPPSPKHTQSILHPPTFYIQTHTHAALNSRGEKSHGWYKSRQK